MNLPIVGHYKLPWYEEMWQDEPGVGTYL
jgi:hypothetical protein